MRLSRIKHHECKGNPEELTWVGFQEQLQCRREGIGFSVWFSGHWDVEAKSQVVGVIPQSAVD